MSPHQLLQIFEELLFEDCKMDAASRLHRNDLFQLMQVYFLELYFQQTLPDDNDDLIRQHMLELLNTLSNSLSNTTDLVSLSKAMYMLISNDRPTSSLFRDMQNNWNPELANCAVHAVDMLQKLIANANLAKYSPSVNGLPANDPFAAQHMMPCRQSHVSEWTKAACEMLIQICFPSHPKGDSFDFSVCLRRLILNDIWKPDEIVELLSCLAAKFNPQNPKTSRIVEFMLAYRIPATLVLYKNQTVLELLKSSDVCVVFEQMKTVITRGNDSNLDEILNEIKVCKWTSDSIVDRIRRVVNESFEQLHKYGYPGQLCGEKDGASKQNWRDCIVSGAEIGQLTNRQLATSLAGLCCAVKKVTKYWPRVAQMVSWIILLLAEDTHGRLVEISTGEGKSCIIAMVSAMLAAHGKSVDIVTSSPILAKRDTKEWKPFYTLFNLKVDHNSDKESDKERQQCYKSDVVYGTVNAFAADILRQEFQMESVRPDRTCDAVVVDEVDFMLLDKGVQFTYLSNKAAGLRHLEYVLAMGVDRCECPPACRQHAGRYLLHRPNPAVLPGYCLISLIPAH